MNLDLTGKNALVGGSSRGIGKAIAIELAKLGATVTLLARDAAKLSEVVHGLDDSKGQQHNFISVNYTDPADLRKKIHTLVLQKPMHILINNTGGPAGGAITDADADAFLGAFRQHVVANQTLTQTVLPGMKAEGYGRIINVISTSVKQPIPGLGVSNTIRGAVANWSKTLAGEVGRHGITVNNVLPGFTTTERLEQIVLNKMDKLGKPKEEVEQMMMDSVPLRRFAAPEEVAAVAAFLASPAAAYVNGINVPVDGGRTKSL